MTISGIASTSPFSPSQTSDARNSVRQQFSTLFQDIQSGNLSAAQSDYSALTQLLGNGTGGGSGTASASGTTGAASGQSGPFGQLLSQIGGALQSGDIGSAQSALSSFQTQAQAQAQGPAGAGGHHHHGGGSDSGVEDALAQLIQSVQSGDLTSAQQAYATLTQTGSASNSTDGTSSASALFGTSSASTTSNSTDASGSTSSSAITGNSLFAQLLAGLGSSLANNDIATAQQDLSTFAQNWKPGTAVSIAA